MEDATKNSIKTLAILFGSFGAFVAFAYLVPDDSEVKKIAGIVLLVIIGLATIYFTPLGNPLKALYRKWKGVK